jgi:hypothetical protein
VSLWRSVVGTVVAMHGANVAGVSKTNVFEIHSLQIYTAFNALIRGFAFPQKGTLADFGGCSVAAVTRC